MGNAHTTAAGQVAVRAFEGMVEFSRSDPRRIGLPTAWLAMGAAWKDYPGRGGGLLHGVQLQDLASGRTQRHDDGEHALVEEHILVPKAGRNGERDAWLLGPVLNLLDAAHIEDGSVAQAVLPYALPLGFHRNFTAA